MMDTTAESIVSRLGADSIGLDILRMSGNWRYLHVVADEFPGNGNAMRMALARLEVWQMRIFISVSVLNSRCVLLHFLSLLRPK